MQQVAEIAEPSTAPTSAAGAVSEWLKNQPALLMVVSMTLWVILEIFAVAMMGDTPIPQSVWLRYLFHICLMLALIGPTAGLSFVRTSRPALHIVRSLMMLIMPLSFWAGQRWGTVGDLMSAFWLVPAVVVVLAAPLATLGSNRRALIAAVVGWIGAIVIYGPSFQSWPAILFGLAMAGSFALYIVLTSILDRTEALLTNLFWSAVAVLAVLTIALPFYWQPLSLHALAGALIIAILGWLTLATLDLALRRWPPTAIAALLLLQPVLDVLVRARLHGRMPDPPEAIGLLLLIGAIVAGAGAAGRLERRMAVAE
jgi:drug/metabolite transporter (DMT)-like permease